MTNALELTAADVMTTEVITVSVDDRVEDAVQFLIDARITGAPVVDRWGNAQGVFTLTNACDLNGLAGNGSGDAEDSSAVIDAVALLTLDLRTRFPDTIRLEDRFKDKLVREVMTPHVETVLETSPLTAATNGILDRGMHRIFVRDAGNKLVGVITSLDLLRVLAEVLEGKVGTELPT